MDHSTVPKFGYWAAYVHLTGIPVQRGDIVGAGEPIGRATNDVSGCKGLASGALHVHFSLIDPWQGNEGQYKDPVREQLIFCQKHAISKDDRVGVVFAGLTTTQQTPFRTPC
jgi:murein DD-endopeptidase MepM/ murein hydrolase activator NlpD